MKKYHQRQVTSWALFILMLFVALLCCKINEDRSVVVSILLVVMQTAIYIGLVVIWVISASRRIVQVQTRKLFRVIGVLLCFWFWERGMRYYVLGWFDSAVTIKRYFWYGYYIPLLALPISVLIIACTLRKPDTYRLPKPAIVSLVVPSLLLLLGVMTNNLHQQVFRFPAYMTVFSDDEYSYGILYYLCLIWIAGCAVASILVMLKKYRLPNGKKILWLPLFPIALGACYAIGYIFYEVPYVMDFTTAYSFLLIAVLETAISVGLIPSNTHYEELLAASDLPMVIAEQSMQPVFASRSAGQLDPTLMRKAVDNGFVTEDGKRISAYPITNGYVFWGDDITKLLQMNENLQEMRSELKEQYLVTQKAYQTSRKRQVLVEKNRLYNIMQSETQEKVETLSALTEKLNKEVDKDDIHALVVEAAVLCAYLKRRNNLLFIREGSDVINGAELTYCIRESLKNFELSGALVEMKAELSKTLSFETITKIYDMFETALEAALHTTEELFVVLQENEDAVLLRMNFVCRIDLSDLSSVGFQVDQDDDREWVLEYVEREGGVSG